MFAAAGNTHVTTPTQPAANPNVYAVTAGLNGQVASWANYGSFVDILGPGTSYATINGQTWVVTGTSSAAAYTSGKTAGLADSTGVSPTSAATTIQTSMGFQSTIQK
jgi:hypothetical protein